MNDIFHTIKIITIPVKLGSLVGRGTGLELDNMFIIRFLRNKRGKFNDDLT